MTFAGWSDVAERLRERAAQLEALDANGTDVRLNKGQRAMLRAVACRITGHGLIVADEVGMGKTRIAVELARCVKEAGGRVAVLVPPGLGFQWRDELRDGGLDVPPILRSIDAYFAAWAEAETSPGWSHHNVLIVSHAFANWSLKGNVKPWRWALLPEVYAEWRKSTKGRYPRNHSGRAYSSEARAVRVTRRHTNKPKTDDSTRLKQVERAARSIVSGVDSGEIPAAVFLDQLIEQGSWNDGRKPGSYTKGDDQRHNLEQVVGLGLGAFDLVIIDEAHKSRGATSVLSTLLKNVLLEHACARTVGMTATPVEIDARQWIQSLERIGIKAAAQGQVMTSVTRYSDAIRRVRSAWRSSAEARREFAEAATAFEAALSPFVLRRDKREDAAVQSFHAVSGRPINQYRDETRAIVIDPTTLPLDWRHAVCAAEAMSIVSRKADGSQTKRLRLTMGNGHGIAACIDTPKEQDPGVHAQGAQDDDDEDVQPDSTPADSEAPVGADAKRAARLDWWVQRVHAVARHNDGTLFEHPAILAAVRAIEAETRAGEKVLVFGRFTAPMMTLVSLLNAREMLRRLAAAEPWPQAGVAQGDRLAVAAAWRQEHGVSKPVDIDAIDSLLAQRYESDRAPLEQTRKALLDSLTREVPARTGTDNAGTGDANFAALVAAMQRASMDESAIGQLATVARALAETMGDSAAQASDEMTWKAFRELLDAAVDRGEGDADGDGQLDDDEAGDLWLEVVQRLGEEFDRPQGGFARLMNGGTAPSTRRLLQQAFNRPQSFPRVLVAQSMVGREGLNLHKACRIVVMLHLEWNPGVVEQQIGRVDRVQSHWAMQVEAARRAGVPASELPRIEIRPVIFSGTYDEHHWGVLRERWDDLRAQLHGDVLPERLAGQALSDQDAAALREILDAAPSFSPSPIALKDSDVRVD